ncbi:serine hydrolase [Verrucomicrobium spinosum]|nr:serine hydrolase [Verrucomicrobium spinosum]
MKDMLVYLEAHLHPRDEAVRLALTKTTGQGREAAALGWQLTRLKNGDELTWHNGGTFGFSSFCGFVRNRDFGVVVLSNSGESVDGLAAKVLRK